MKQVLVTGGFGYVGGRIVNNLSAGHTVTASTRSLLPAEQLAAHGPVAQVTHAQLLDANSFPAGIDTVIHLAALNEHDCVAQPAEAIRVNINETRMVLENAITQGVQQFIFFSTAHIYGAPLKGVITEQSLPAPVHPYAITHKAAEDYVLAATQYGKIKGTVVRLSNAFGAPVLPSVNRWTLLVNDLCKQAIEKKQLTIQGNGCQYRDFICLADVAGAVQQFVAAPEAATGVYNLGSGKAMQVMEMARFIAQAYKELWGTDIPIVLPPGSSPTNEPALHYSVEKIQQLGIALPHDIQQEIKEMLLFCKRHFSNEQ